MTTCHSSSKGIADSRAQHPIDTGWAWCVLIASTVSFLIYGGIHRGFGVLFVEFRNVYGSSSATMSTVVSIQNAFTSISGMLVMAFGMRYLSSRQCVVIAGFVCAISLILTSVAKNVIHLIFTHSILTGISCAFQIGPTIVVVGRYFDKRRVVAISLIQGACSLGALVFAPLFRYLIDRYLLKGALLLVAGIACHMVPTGLLLRPPELYEKWARKNKSEIKESLMGKKLDDPYRPRSVTSESLTDNLFTRSRQDVLKNTKTNDYSLSENELYSSNFNGERYPREHVCADLKIYGSSEIPMVIPFGSDSNGDFNDKYQETFKSGSCSNSSKCMCISQFFSVSIYKNASYDIFTIGYTLGVPVVATVVYIPDVARDNGIQKEQAALLVSVYMVGEIIGRSGSGFCPGKLINGQTVIGISLFIVGVIQNLVRYCTTYWSLVFFAFSNGLFGGPIHGLYASIIADILGIEDLRSGLCVLQLTQGIVWGCVLPIAGYIRDISDSYVLSYHFVGGLAICASLILLLGNNVVKFISDISLAKYSDKKDIELDT